MCGIAGFINFGTPADPEEIKRVTRALHHRGPDGQDTFIDQDVALGHTRLAIMDLSESGKCPMPYGGEDHERYWITYNGEVYNFLELRRELEGHGHKFRTDTDTEVVLASYAQWGEQCLLKFNGMWAFGIWDTQERTLFLSRDRFGIKPLYFMFSDRFLFASELKAFIEFDNFKARINPAAVNSALLNSYSYEGSGIETGLSGVNRLPGGYFMKIRADGRTETRKWWETRDHIPEVPGKYSDQVERFRELFLNAVKLRMRSDVPVSTCLSGGMDSSAIASSMAFIQKQNEHHERTAADWQHSFIATFPGTSIDERVHADKVVRHIDGRPHYWTFTDEEALRHLIDSVWSMEEIYGGIAVPAWCTYKQLPLNNIKVSIDGHGGDELLFGYTWYLDWTVNQAAEKLYSDFHTTLLPSILRNFDRCSMAHGVEIRMPFMDWNLVTYAFGLPIQSRAGGGYTKRILRDALKGILPDPIRCRRQKIGFNSPMIEWFNGGMSDMIRKIVGHRLWVESPFFNGPGLGKLVLDKTAARAWTQDDWGLSLKVWVRMNIVLWQMMFTENCIGDIR